MTILTTTNTSEQDTSLFNKNHVMQLWKAKPCVDACVWSLAGLFLLVWLRLLFPLRVVLCWFSCAFLAGTGQSGHVPVDALRILLRCWNGWPWFPRMMTLLLASRMFGFLVTLLGWTTHCMHSPARLWEEWPIPVMMMAREGPTPYTR